MDFNLYSISKRGIFSSTYDIYNEGVLLFTVKKKSFFGWKFIFYDNYKEKFMSLNHVFKFFKTSFKLFREEELLAIITRTKGAFKNNFIVETDDITYTVNGDFKMRSFTINDGINDVARVSRKPRTRKNMYGIAISSEEDQELILGIAFAMEVSRKLKQSKSG